jgi:hypothetical protein
MASEKQITANRENAKKSGGPKTTAGRLRSSRNAFRHGLSLPLRLDRARLKQLRAVTKMLVPDQADERRVLAAVEVAQALLVEMQVGAIRRTMLAELDPASASSDQIGRLAALDRYQARALTRRRRASHILLKSEGR